MHSRVREHLASECDFARPCIPLTVRFATFRTFADVAERGRCGLVFCPTDCDRYGTAPADGVTVQPVARGRYSSSH